MLIHNPYLLLLPLLQVNNQGPESESEPALQQSLTVEGHDDLHGRELESSIEDKKRKKKEKVGTILRLLHCDVIQDEFWAARPKLLGR